VVNVTNPNAAIFTLPHIIQYLAGNTPNRAHPLCHKTVTFL
jgi:hypothetical protein